MAKWFKVLMAVIMFAVMTTSSSALGKEPSQVEIDRLAKQIAKDNPKFSNPDLIYPGDTVRVKERKDGKYEISMYNVAPWMVSSENGCLWQIAKLHLNGTLRPTSFLRSDSISLTASGNDIGEESWLGKYGWLLGVLLFVLMLALLIAHFIRKDAIEDPDTHPPVVTGGLPDDPTQAAPVITRNYPTLAGGKPLKQVTRGVMRRHSGPPTISVVMQFGDGTRTVKIKDGDAAYKAEYTDGTIHYFRQHCGNLYAPIASGRFELPQGWSFEAQVTSELTQTPTQPCQPEARPQETPKPTEPEKSTKTAEPAKVESSDPKEVEIEIGDGSNKLIVKAKGDQEHMPTKIEHGGGKTIIFFPYKPDNK